MFIRSLDSTLIGKPNIFPLGGHLGINPAQAALTDIRFNTETGIPYDAKGNMQPELNQVPCAVFGGNDNVNLGSSVGNFGVNDFTVEGWFRYTDDTVYNTLFSKGYLNDYSEYFAYVRNNKIYFWSDSYFITDNSLNKDTWYYFEIYRIGNIVYISVDGVTTVSDAVFNNDFNNSKTFRIGSRNDGTSAYFNGNIFGVKINGVLLPIQEFTGDKTYSQDGSIVGTWQGIGQHWTRVDGIPSYNQANGFKLVKLTSGDEAYIPLSVSDTEIETEYGAANIDSITPLLQDGKSFLADGSELDLHPTINNNIIPGSNPVVTYSDYLDSIELSSGIDLNAIEAGAIMPDKFKATVNPNISTTGIKLLKP